MKKRIEYDATEIASVAGGSAILTTLLYLTIYIL